ncbi:hypothetical protein BD779DRAFT_1804883, partial [Infundibulicybe gibba]
MFVHSFNSIEYLNPHHELRPPDPNLSDMDVDTPEMAEGIKTHHKSDALRDHNKGDDGDESNDMSPLPIPVVSDPTAISCPKAGKAQRWRGVTALSPSDPLPNTSIQPLDNSA